MQSHTRKRVGRAGVVAGFAFALVPVVGISPAHACSCVAATEAQHLEAADVVFKGTVESVTTPAAEDGEPSPADPVIYTFDVTRKYKGSVLNPQKVVTAQSSATCGLALSGAGPFLVFASEPEGPAGGSGEGEGADSAGTETTEILQASLCGGTREIGANEDPSFGPGEPVAAQAESEDGNTTEGNGSPGRAGLLETVLDRLGDLLRGLLGDTRTN